MRELLEQVEPKWPSHAYIPGHNSRHPKGTFDAIRTSASMGQPIAELAECLAYQTGLRYLQSGFYWEAHEVLEPVWMALPDDSEERHFVQALIQIANGHLKLTMQRPKATRRLCDIARQLLAKVNSDYVMNFRRLDAVQLIDKLEQKAD